MAFLIGGANSAADTAYSIDNSIRLNLPDEHVISNDPGGGSGSDGSRTVWTFSCWFKRSRISDQQYLASAATDGNNYGTIKIGSNDSFYVNLINSGSDQDEIVTNAVFRDMSAWYHVVVAVDKTEAALGDGIKIYINGVRTTSFGTSTYAQNEGYHFSRPGKTTYIGVTGGDNDWWDGYMAEVHFVDGTQKAHTDFGEFDEDSGIWKPKKYSGAYGTYGYFLEFKGTGTSEDSSGIGADTSGNDEHFAVSNLAAADQCTDTPTNNFCTLNPLWSGAAGTLSEGNTKLVSGSSEYGPILGTIAMTSGKWYWEVLCTTFNYWRTGIADVTLPVATDWNLGYESSPDNAVYRDGGIVAKNASAILTGQPSLAVDETVSVAFDADSGKIWFAQDGTWINSGDPAAGSNEATSVTTGESYFPAVSDGNDSTSSTYSFNFGNPPHSISSGNADANGYGNFEYAVPSGFYALCTKNLAEFGG